MKNLWETYLGYAIGEITEPAATLPRVEKINPEAPSLRVSPKAEADPIGHTPVTLPETDRSLKELHDADGNLTQNYTLEVVIPEACPIYTGTGKLIDEVSRKPLSRRFSFKLQTPDNKNVTGAVTEYPSIKCYYLGHSNASVPHVTVGEQVLVYHYLGSDIFYWKELGRDNELRRLEKYRIFVADQQKVDKEADTALTNKKRINDDNSYYLEFDTINKHILLSTANSDGETIRYFLKMNTKTNTFSIWDTKGNRFEIDSDEHRLYMRNQEQSVVDIHGTNINMWSQDSITIESDTVTVVSRKTKNDIIGMSDDYKAYQLAQYLHNQAFLGPTGNNIPFIINGKTFYPMTGSGQRTKLVSTQENTIVPNKVDIIASWKTQNINYTLSNTGEINITGINLNSTMTGLVTKTYNVFNHIVLNGYVIKGNVTQGPLMILTTLRARHFPPYG